jgi:glycolate oxidase
VVGFLDTESAAPFWRARNAIYGAVGRLNNYYALDCAVPLGKLEAALGVIEKLTADWDVQQATVLHCGDGTVHTFLLYDPNVSDSRARAHRCGDAIRAGCVALGGALSAEYGIGLEKRDLLTLQYSHADLTQQMQVRAAFVPDFRLNPGKVFPSVLET